MTLNEIITLNKTDCDCKKIHKSCLDGVIIENGAICKLANAAKRYDAKKAFLLSDPNGHELEQTLGDSKGQESLVCCSPWGRKESDTT